MAPGAANRGSWRAAAVFWAVVLGVAGPGAAYLQYLGPPPVAAARAHPLPMAAVAAPVHLATVLPPAQAAPPAQAEVIDGVAASTLGAADLPRGAPIPSPLPALLKNSAINPNWHIPRIASDGLTPAQAYAASQLPPPADALLPPDVPRVAILVAGLGDDENLDEIAAALPPEISLGLSPYGKVVAAAAGEARQAGHETILVLPMPGLLAGYPPRQNQSTLDWAMAQAEGYAGVTDAFDLAMGGGFLASPTASTWLLTTIARQGLFYIEGDPNAGATPYTAGRRADIVIDASDGPADEAVKLSALITEAQSQHAALAIMLHPTPDALHALGLWTSTLVNQDVLLVPASALVQPPDIPLPIDASLKQ